MALPIGRKNQINTTQGPEKKPTGALPTGPDRMPTKPVTPQTAANTPKKGPGLPVGGRPKGGC